MIRFCGEIDLELVKIVLVYGLLTIFTARMKT